MHRHSTNALSFAGVCVFFLCSASPILEHSPIAAAAADVKRGPEAAFVASPQAWLHKERGRSHMTCSSSSRSVRMAACGAKRAAVVGAGAAGLAAAKQLRADGHTVRVFEMSNDVGGVWQYNDTVEADPMGNPVDMRVHSSMYVSLRTNLPREVMAFDDFPFTDEFDERRFPHHSAVQRYLSKYADTFELRPLISFDRKVTNLRPVRSQSAEGEHKGFRDVSWSLEHSAAGGGGQVEEEEFDVVMVCNGHYSEPWSPVFEGQESWSGTTSHSHNYRSPSAFAGKRVVVIGASASGEDISRDVSSVAAKVWLSARSWQNPDWGAPDAPPFGPQQNIERKVPIKRLLASGGVEFEDGSILEDVHHLLFCTGYRYRFPFLEDHEVVRIEDNAVLPLYKHMLPPHAPSIAFIGLPSKVIPFPQFEVQSRFVSQVWAGNVPLPSPEAMLTDVNAEIDRKLRAGVPKKYFHVQGGAMFAYNDELATLSGGAMTPMWRVLMHNQCSRHKRTFPEQYRDLPLPSIAEYQELIEQEHKQQAAAEPAPVISPAKK